jgi:hypothetical protein
MALLALYCIYLLYYYQEVEFTILKKFACCCVCLTHFRMFTWPLLGVNIVEFIIQEHTHSLNVVFSSFFGKLKFKELLIFY